MKSFPKIAKIFRQQFLFINDLKILSSTSITRQYCVQIHEIQNFLMRQKTWKFAKITLLFLTF